MRGTRRISKRWPKPTAVYLVSECGFYHRHLTPKRLVDELRATALNPENHHYPAMRGSMPFRGAVAGWYQKRFGVDLDPDQEVHALLGSKEGLAHISLCFLNPGDIALVPDPAFPAYRTGVVFAGGKPVALPLLPENDYLANFASLPTETLEKARLLFQEAGVALTPGPAFGESGEGFARISLTASNADVRGAMEQLSDFLQSRPSLVPDAGADGCGTRSDRRDTLPRRIQWERGCS